MSEINLELTRNRHTRPLSLSDLILDLKSPACSPTFTPHCGISSVENISVFCTSLLYTDGLTYVTSAMTRWQFPSGRVFSSLQHWSFSTDVGHHNHTLRGQTVQCQNWKGCCEVSEVISSMPGRTSLKDKQRLILSIFLAGRDLMGSSKPAEQLVQGINLMGFWLKIVARWKRIWKTSLQDRSNTTPDVSFLPF